MESALYVALSAQVALSNRLETVSRNVANMNTAGYRADEIKFSELVSKAAQDPVSFASAGTEYISRQGGAIEQTDNPLDLAIDGEAWFALRTPQGVVYTRDGRLRMDAEGTLRSVNGHPILDAGGLPIQLDPEAGPPLVSQSGEVRQGEDQVAAIGVFEIDPATKLVRQENSGVVPDLPATPVQEFTRTAIRQGYVEGANVNPIREMTKLIMITRAFEGVTKMIDASGEAQQTAIRELGANS
ncbi:flagellar basal-body rod protein FlgF [Roseibium aestuarii]|uniref:Flagellar basal-body rod protein FlgF n=1 Tax=Roseibium aestuarii TaxID=2600299 RepID=A0ABW4JWK1_9HYPH|nr:flagellar basal-body rod protein FlgF [Roseibium aestuarii]